MRFIQRLSNSRHNFFKGIYHVGVREAQDAKPTRFEQRLTLFIIAFLVDLIMNRTVDLNDQAAFDADEIHDEPFDRVLPPELRSTDAASSDALPEDIFSRCGRVPHLLRQQLQLFPLLW